MARFEMALAASAMLLWACGASTSAAPADAGVDVAAIDGGGGDDAMSVADAGVVDNGEASTTYPAFKPPVPQLVDNGGSKMHAPTIRPVYFAGETLATGINDGLTQWLTTTWPTQLAEYGFGTATLAPIVLTESAAPNVGPRETETWLRGKLDGTHTEFGAVDAATLANEVFVIFYPATTTIGTPGTCVPLSGYHDATAGNAPISYVVIPRCTTTVASMTTVASNLTMSTVGDPLPVATGSLGWNGFDPDHVAWVHAIQVAELAQPCFASPPALVGTNGDVAIARAWSNVAMRGYHDPCVPAPADSYFAAVPIMTDQLIAPRTKGVKLARGETKSIEVQMLSDGPTSGPWSVTVTPVAPTAPTDLTFALDRDHGQNGEKLHLKITSNATMPAYFVVTSTLGARTTRWFGLVAPH